MSFGSLLSSVSRWQNAVMLRKMSRSVFGFHGMRIQHARRVLVVDVLLGRPAADDHDRAALEVGTRNCVDNAEVSRPYETATADNPCAAVAVGRVSGLQVAVGHDGVEVGLPSRRVEHGRAEDGGYTEQALDTVFDEAVDEIVGDEIRHGSTVLGQHPVLRRNLDSGVPGEDILGHLEDRQTLVGIERVPHVVLVGADHHVVFTGEDVGFVGAVEILERGCAFISTSCPLIGTMRRRRRCPSNPCRCS